MLVSSLEIDGFRNLRRVALQCSPTLNLIVGENASGKTSVLEALYFLGRARSFRTAQVRELIAEGAARLRIVAMMSDAAGGHRIPVGIERSARDITARIGGAPVGSLAQLAMHVPVLLLNPDSHRLLEEGPQQRRRFMDWVLFHLEAAFLPAWRRYATALRHRNAALRRNFGDRGIDAWDEELADAATTLDRLRRLFCAELKETLGPLVGALLGMAELGVDYRRGWAKGQDLIELLHAGRDQDRKLGFTRLGPHRADFRVRFGSRPAPEYLSRGQQKLLVIALVLAQARLYQRHKEAASILLIDDLPAELDRTHRDRVIGCLGGIGAQLFVTAIEAESLDVSTWSGARVFRIDHGEIGDGTSAAHAVPERRSDPGTDPE